MAETLLHYDKVLFYLINRAWISGVLDMTMPFFREKLFWMPLYIFFFSFLLINFKRKGFIIFLFMLLCVLFTDQLSATILKPLFGRFRPCSDPSFSEFVRLMVDHCRHSFSFPSAHGANHFGIAAFFSFVFHKKSSLITWLLFLWAALVGYAQIYVGLHYPIDILGGALLGILVGFVIGTFCNKVVDV